MTVGWSRTALDDREELLEIAFDRAKAQSDPQLYQAAVAQDDRIEAEGGALDGIAIWQEGPLPDSHLYITRDGLFVILYRRDAATVNIERVLPSRSNWKPAP